MEEFRREFDEKLEVMKKDFVSQLKIQSENEKKMKEEIEKLQEQVDELTLENDIIYLGEASVDMTCFIDKRKLKWRIKRSPKESPSKTTKSPKESPSKTTGAAEESENTASCSLRMKPLDRNEKVPIDVPVLLGELGLKRNRMAHRTKEDRNKDKADIFARRSDRLLNTIQRYKKRKKLEILDHYEINEKFIERLTKNQNF